MSILDVAHRLKRRILDWTTRGRPVTALGARWVAIPGDEVFESLRRSRSYREAEVAFLLKVLSPGDTFWDVGANFGLYAVLAAQEVGPSGSVLAIEPDPTNRERLRQNLELNDLRNVEVLPIALGDREGRTEFNACSQGAYSGLRIAKVPGKVRKIQVDQKTLDSIAQARGWPPVKFLKMDVEGAELLVLRGAAKFFAEGSVRPLVMCEFSDRRSVAYGYSCREVHEWLALRGYSWFSFAPDGSLAAQPAKEHYDFDNLLACPGEKSPLLESLAREALSRPMTDRPRITFGIIVLNGEPFTRYCLRQVYPFAHRIVVVEGACERARSIATPDGHSTDATLEVLRDFQRREDPEGKVEVVTRKGFWSEKDEQSQAFAERTTGDYLWQVDIDEFYTAEAMRAIVEMLRTDPAIAAVSFPMRTFWGSPDVLCDGLYLRSHDPARAWNPSEIHRVFRWGPGYRYATHRPPTVLDAAGRDVRLNGRWANARATRSLGVWMLHYSLLFPRQVREKCAYYEAMDWDVTRRAREWAEECYMRLNRPFHVHNVRRSLSWLRSYEGPWPEQIEAMWRDIGEGRMNAETRPMEDARALMARPSYRLARAALEAYAATLLNPLLRVWGLIHGIGVLRHLRRWLRRCAS